MGADGCVRVCWDAGATGRYKNKVSRHKNGCAGHNLGPMAGEISPNIMFCGCSQKWSRMGENGCISVRMGEDGCISNEKSKNKAKRPTNG